MALLSELIGRLRKAKDGGNRSSITRAYNMLGKIGIKPDIADIIVAEVEKYEAIGEDAFHPSPKVVEANEAINEGSA